MQQLIDNLRSLCLSGFVQALQEQHESKQYLALSFEDRLSFLIDKELRLREDRRLQRSLHKAKLKQRAAIESVDYRPTRGVSRQQILSLAQCVWVQKNQNLIITGPTGVGKSFIACALADKACRLKYNARYYKLHELITELMLARVALSYKSLLNRFSKFKVVVLDEWLRDPLPQDEARELLNLIDDRYGKASFVFASQLPVTKWHEQILDPTLADAILDRIVHGSHRIELSGISMRKEIAAQNEQATV